jgi:hypothetical protein
MLNSAECRPLARQLEQPTLRLASGKKDPLDFHFEEVNNGFKKLGW